MPLKTPDITLYFLQMSRGIRIAWLLHELDLPYKISHADRRADNGMPPDDWAKSHPSGASPAIHDGKVYVAESGCISEYLCRNYDKEHRLIPQDEEEWVQVTFWMYASEATYMLHALPMQYAKRATQDKAVRKLISDEMASFCDNDLRRLEETLAKSSSGWLVGDHLTAADINMHFSISFQFEANLGVNAEYPNIQKWLKKCEATPSYKAAVEYTGHRSYAQCIGKDLAPNMQ